MTDSPPPGPAGTWCPKCGLFWNVRGCTPEKCASPEADAQEYGRVMRGPTEAHELRFAPAYTTRGAFVVTLPGGREGLFATREEAESFAAEEKARAGERIARALRRQGDLPVDAGMPWPPADEHPTPWRWETDRGAKTRGTLLDANGAVLISEDFHVASDGTFMVASPRVRALTESASEAAVSLRWALGAIDQFLAQEGHWPAERGTDEADEKALAEAKALLARIDERSRG
jgi:hypothetical protein